MELNQSQKTALKAAITADATMAAFVYNGNYSAVAAVLNALASPAFIVWKTSVSIDEIMRNGMDWARVDNLSVGKARIWEWMGKLGTFDSSKSNIRAGIDACWVGTSADLAVRAAVYVHCKRSATLGEKVLATGTGSDASPATLTVEGAFSAGDVEQSLVGG